MMRIALMENQKQAELLRTKYRRLTHLSDYPSYILPRLIFLVYKLKNPGIDCTVVRLGSLFNLPGTMNNNAQNPKGRHDLEERVTHLQSVTNYKGDFKDAKSPLELEDGALVAGGALDLLSKEAFALFSQYAAIGVIYGLIPALNFPIFNVYLRLEGYQTASYSTLVMLGWSFKAFMGMMSDCFPIFGYRRKSWLLIGWMVTMICLTIMTFSSLGEPYCNREKAAKRKSRACTKPYSNASLKDHDLFNLSAPDNGGLFIILSMFVSLGYVTAACASDAMVVQYAQREPLAIRGRIQTAIYTVRTFTGIVSSVIVGFGLNGANYNGSFQFSMAPNVPYGICLVPCVVVVLSTIFIVEEVKTPPIPLKVWAGSFWDLLQQRVMWQICAFRFINNIFQGIGSTAGAPMFSIWANVEPLNDALASVLGGFIFSGILVVVGKWGLHWNWRWAIALSSIGSILIDGAINFMTIWNVVRNQCFYMGGALAEKVPGGVRFIVATYCAVEIADVGNEGATYGLVTTVSNLASPFASVIYKVIDSYFMLSQDDIRNDTTQVRWDVTYSYIISYMCKLFALAWLWMLPPQRTQIQELKKKGGKSPLAGAILLVIFFICLAFSVTTSIMSIYPSTKCYRIAGGNGMFDPKSGACPTVTAVMAVMDNKDKRLSS
ncbi:hypothetical protein DYB25_008914 [Aphanomyces astaci]|uniref:Major facilitator superfamily (MFS) profile domain-containing protein n=1 Tax=Aphanomyces astaci TaxID=112090 RepID=A0A397DP85_APHAT|nr:hypothetical protein DYB25_008914 [Aphanomyces astaci]RHY65816.1 hypothetical protein DYB38_009811 [Aphanomyces astaci]RHZ41315.1 hypothetical protein DYB26_007210 [Aphanomyces astaci]